jgi:hypothetical protein
VDEEQEERLPPLGDEFNAVVWSAQRLHVICYVHNEEIQPLVDRFERVEQEPYVIEGCEESVLRMFTSAEAAREFLSHIPLKPEYIKYLKIVSMDVEKALDVVKYVDRRYHPRGNFVRFDVIAIDNGIERREILFSRLIATN